MCKSTELFISYKPSQTRNIPFSHPLNTSESQSVSDIFLGFEAGSCPKVDESYKNNWSNVTSTWNKKALQSIYEWWLPRSFALKMVDRSC